MRRLFSALLALALAFAWPSLASASDIELHGTVTCTDVATEIRPSIPNRAGLFIYSNGATVLYHGQHTTTNTLTSGNGTPLKQDGTFAFEAGEMTGAYHCITASGTTDVRWKETFR